MSQLSGLLQGLTVVDGCWLYGKAPADAGGHSHRGMYRLVLGRIPEGSAVRGCLDTPGCVNPEHLSIRRVEHLNLEGHNG